MKDENFDWRDVAASFAVGIMFAVFLVVGLSQ